MNTKILVGLLSILLLANTKLTYSQYNTKVIVTDVNDERVKANIESNSSALLTALNTAFFEKKDPKLSAKGITKDVMPTLLNMWETSKFRCTETELIERAIKRPQGGFEIRNIPIFMEEADPDDKNQEIALIYTNDGIIDDIYLTMESNRYVQLANEGTDVKEYARRQILLDFLENFRTAYNRKDIDYIDKVYSEEALIITGKVIKISPENKDLASNYLNKEIITYQRQTKGEYMSKLKTIFKNNSYINIKFEDIELKRHPKYPSIYGLNMMQAWNTQRYSDEGYLFLMVDFTDENKPLIHVRTWQPNKINGKTLSEEEKFKLEMFNPQK